MNFVTPKIGAKHELLFNKPASVVCTFVIEIVVNPFTTISMTVGVLPCQQRCNAGQ